MRRSPIILASAVVVAFALFAAGCGGARSHVAQLSSTTPNGVLAFARCIRANGVSTYPDPTSSGQLVKKTPQQLGVSSSQFQAAQTACQRLLPNSGLPPGAQPTPVELTKMERDALTFARCMRSHGVQNWPDYTLRDGIPIFDLHGTSIAPNSPQIVGKQGTCKSMLHARYSPPTSGGAQT